MNDACRAYEERLERIEAKLDALIKALADEEENDGPTDDLEGNPLPAERDATQSLG